MPEPPASRRVRPRGRVEGPRTASGEPPAHWEIRQFASIDSTNRYLLAAARSGASDGLVAVADHQSAGRGRLGRSWEAAPGAALLVSVLVRPTLAPERIGVLTMAAGLALVDAVRAVAGVEAALKWPNDLVVGDRKLAGLLAEADLGPGVVRAVVVGAGCNLAVGAYPPELAELATSVVGESGRPVDRDAVLDGFLDALDARLADLDAVPSDYRAHSATLGRRVRVELGADRRLVGTAVDLTATGALVVRNDDGVDHTVAVGDVVHLRT